MHTSSRLLLCALAASATAAGATAPALAGPGQSSTHLPTLTQGDRVGAPVRGTDGPALYHTGDHVHAHDAILRVRVRTPAHKGLAVRLTCPKGAVSGYGFVGKDGLAVNGHPIAGRHSLVVRVQAGQDTDHDGLLRGTLLALCQGA